MGCCMSTQQASLPYQPQPKRRRLADPVGESVDKAKDDTSSRKTPPPPLLYVEEKVKGVLIETPFPNPKPMSIKQPQNQTLNHPKPFKTPTLSSNVDKIILSTKTLPQLQVPPPGPLPPPSTASMSTARSGFKRERVMVQSPTWKPGFHPGRINGGLVKMVQSREPGAVVSKTDPVLGPWKRSGSPVVARVSNSGVERPVADRGLGAGRRNNPSQGRVRRDPTRKGKNHAVNGQVINGKESMESPMVSLECFIFL